MENKENQSQQNISDDAWTRFNSNIKGIDTCDYFGVQITMADCLYNIGQFELAKRWAYTYFKYCLDDTIKDPHRGWSHMISKGYWEIMNARIDNEFRRRLGESLGMLYESGGRFAIAYEYYRDNCPDKYAEKLESVILENNGEEDWRFRVPGNNGRFPDFHSFKTKEEHNVLVGQLTTDLMKCVPEEIMKIEAQTEFKILADKISKIKRA